MPISPLRREIYNYQADRMEKAFLSLELPTRVRGGEVGKKFVRYHLTPQADASAHRIREVISKVAESMGSYHVQVNQSEEGWIVDLPLEGEYSLTLLPLIEDLGELLPLTTVLGITANSKLLLLNLKRKETWHVFAYGPIDSGKSELLRTMIISLALKNRPSLVQFLGIDLSGKELAVIEALPHVLADVAIDPYYAEELIAWLADEIERRKQGQEEYPHIFLFVDELEAVNHHTEMMLKELPRILQDGPRMGVHLVATSKEIRLGSLIHDWQKSGVVVARSIPERSLDEISEAERGNFEFTIAGERTTAQVAWLPAWDLQSAVQMIRSGRHSKKSVIDLTP